MSQIGPCNDCKEGKHHPSQKRDDCGCRCPPRVGVPPQPVPDSIVFVQPPPVV